MSAPTVTPRPYRGWDAWHVEAGDLSVILVPQVGGRIMNIGFRGHELLFVHPELAGRVEEVPDTADLAKRKRERGFLLWGGEKTWLAPQARWRDELPFLDLDSGPYDLYVDGAAVTMTSRPCRETGVQVVRTVELAPDGAGFTTIHQLTNRGASTVSWAPWGVSMVNRPGRVYLPTSPTSPFPDGVKTFVSQPGSPEARERVVGRLGDVAVVDCTGPGAFKYGVDPGEGWMLGVVEVAGLGHVGIVKAVEAYPDRPYGHGCIGEVYDSDRYDYFEMEVHGPVTELPPGERFLLRETTRLVALGGWPDDADHVGAIVEGRG